MYIIKKTSLTGKERIINVKYKVGISCAPGIHISHNDSDGIGCAIVTKYLIDYYYGDDDENGGHGPRFPLTHDKNIHFHSIHSALNAVKKLITTIMDIMKGGYDDDLDDEDEEEHFGLSM